MIEIHCLNGTFSLSPTASVVWPQIPWTRIAPSFALEYSYPLYDVTASEHRSVVWTSTLLIPISYLTDALFIYTRCWVGLSGKYICNARLYYSDNHLVSVSYLLFVYEIYIQKQHWFFFLPQSFMYLEYSRFNDLSYLAQFTLTTYILYSNILEIFILFLPIHSKHIVSSTNVKSLRYL